MNDVRAERFRQYAPECEERASKAANPEVAQEFLELAEQWRRLADEIESKS
jgi:hypothetical protein